MVEIVNKRLKKYHGLNPYREPNFRVVWAPHQREMRRGLHNEFYGEIFVRQTFGTYERKKYAYLGERWILERWYDGSMTQHPDLPDSRRGSYEPIFVFEDAQRKELPVNWRVVEKVLWAIFNPQSSSEAKASLEAEAERQKVEEYKKDLEDIGGFETNVGAALAQRSGASFVGLDGKSVLEKKL